MYQKFAGHSNTSMETWSIKAPTNNHCIVDSGLPKYSEMDKAASYCPSASQLFSNSLQSRSLWLALSSHQCP
eukprot:4077605-Amphidinium_carterae.1